MTIKPDSDFKKSIPFIIHKMHWATHQAINRVFEASGIDITMEQFLLMGYLWKNDGISQQELAIHTGKDKAGIARLLDQLSRRGLVERRIDQTDRRVKRIFVTRKGNSIHQSCRLRGQENRERAEQGISEQDLEITRRTLGEMLKNIQKSNGK